MAVSFLSARDAPCPGCGYNLRGVASPLCPECGRRVTLREAVASGATRATRRQPVRLAALGLAAGMALSAVHGVGLAQTLWGRPSGFGPSALSYGAAMLVAMLSFPLSVWWSRRVRGVAARNERLGWTAAAVCWAVVLASLVVFW